MFISEKHIMPDLMLAKYCTESFRAVPFLPIC